MLVYIAAGVAIVIAGLAANIVWLAIVGAFVIVYAAGLLVWRIKRT
jgi:hypothetical protein